MYDLQSFWFSRLEGKIDEILLILDAHGFSLRLNYTYGALTYYWIAYVPSQNSLFLYVESVSQELFENSGFQYVPTEYLLSL